MTDNIKQQGMTLNHTLKPDKSVMPYKAICPECRNIITHEGTVKTLLGYDSPEGHNHDDNCRYRIYQCNNGHRSVVSKKNKCPACDWEGKSYCSLHFGEKIDQWPDNDEDLDDEKTKYNFMMSFIKNQT